MGNESSVQPHDQIPCSGAFWEGEAPAEPHLLDNGSAGASPSPSKLKLHQHQIPPKLDYAKRPPLAWMSRHRKLLIFLAVCIAIGITVYGYREPLKHRVLWLYWSHRAAAFVMTAPMEMAIRDPVKMKAAILANGDYVQFTVFSGTPPMAWYCPVTFRQLLALDPRLGLIRPEGAPVAFMGKMRRPDGNYRLVIVETTMIRADKPMETITLRVLALPGIFDPLPQTPPPPKPSVGGHGNSGRGAVVLGEVKTGRADANDPSHIVFPIVYTPRPSTFRRVAPPPVNHRPLGEIDGYLQNDDSMRFVLRSLSGGREVLGTKPSELY